MISDEALYREWVDEGCPMVDLEYLLQFGTLDAQRWEAESIQYAERKASEAQVW